jgi:pimeloyl-ACP methyl ester carboxylesterase
MSGGEKRAGPTTLGRRKLLAGAAALSSAGAWPARAQRAAGDTSTPIVFVHGNGDSGALWINNFWRFETNGFRRNQLFAIDYTYPNARTDDAVPEALHSSTDDVIKQLAAFVAEVKAATRRRQVALIAQSRGGNIVRGYLKAGGSASASHAILCGAFPKGIFISETRATGSEFNGAAPFLKGLNAGPNDLIAGVDLMAIRSDKNDKYCQPDARYIGLPGTPTGVSYDACDLRGGKNVVLEGLDHRETGYHKLAFAAQYEFITGKPAATLFIAQEPLPTLNGRVTGLDEGLYTNLPVAGAEVEVWNVDPRSGERNSPQAAHRKTTGTDGKWGPFIAHSDASYEFVLRMEGQATTHTYRSPFLRSSDLVHLRPQLLAKGDDKAGAVVVMSRPRGYFGVGRDKFSLDGKVPPEIKEGVPSVSTGKLALDAQPRTVLAVFNNETIAVRTWPAKNNQVTVAEFMN